MRLSCPFCGERGNEEFTYRGDAGVTRPDGQIPQDASAPAWQAWMDYVYFRDNPAGLHRELWYHGGGCRSWLIITRDVRTHEIHAVEPARSAARQLRATVGGE